MASLVLGAAAGAFATGAGGLGLAVGGTAATVVTGIGTAIGGYLDSAYIFPALFGGEGAQESRYGSVTVSTADEGSPIYTAFGRRVRVPALILFGSDAREVRNVRRLSKRRSVTESVWYGDLAIAFGKSYPARTGDLDSVRAIFADGRPIVDLRDDPVVETVSGSVGLPLNRTAGLIVNYQEHREYRTDRGIVLYAGGRGMRTTPGFDVQLTIARAEYRGTPYPNGFTPNRVFPEVRIWFDGPHGIEPGAGAMLWFSPFTSGLPAQAYPYCWVRADLDDPRSVFLPNLASNLGPQAEFWHFSDPANSAAANPSSPSDLVGLSCAVSKGNADGEVLYDLRKFRVGLYTTITDDGNVVWRPNETFGVGKCTAVRGITGKIQEMVNFGRFEDAGYPATSGDVIRITQDRVDYDLDVLEGGGDDVIYLYEPDGVHQQEVSPLLEQWVVGNPAPGFRDMLTVLLRGMNYSSFGNRVPNIEGIITSSVVLLPDVLTQILKHHGLEASQIDVIDVPAATVEGYRYSGPVEGVQALQPLLLSYDLLAQQSGDALRLFPRSSPDEVTIDEDEWVPTDNGQRLVYVRRDTQKPLRSVTVKFYDAFGDQEPGSITVPGFHESNGEDRTLNTSLVLTEAEAREIALRVLRDSVAVRWVITCSLPWTRSEVVENDVIRTTVDGNLHRFRVMSISLGSDLELNITGVTEPEQPSSAVGTAPELALGGGKGITGREDLRAELWTGVDWESGRYFEGGFFVAVSPLSEGGSFGGAAVFVTADNGTIWREAAFVGASAVIGSCVHPLTPLKQSTKLAYNSTEKMVVRLQDGELESIEEAEVLGRDGNLALVGDEVVSFRDATLLNGTDYLLEGFKRGMRSTPAATHFQTDRFVMLGSTVERVLLESWETGRTIGVKVVPIGKTLDEVETRKLDVPLRSDRYFTTTPVNVRGFEVVDQEDGVLLSWRELDAVDLDYYEVRIGPGWLGAPVVGRTKSGSLEWHPPSDREYALLIRARWVGGLWSPQPASVTVNPSSTVVSAVVVETVPVFGTVGGSGTGATEASGVVSIDPGSYEATWEQSALDAGAVGRFWWDVDWGGYAVDERNIEDLPPIELSSADGWTWTDEGREGSPNYPGIGDLSAIADYPMAIEDYPDVDYYGTIGSYGEPTKVEVEARFDANGAGSWTAWESFRPQWREAQKMECRLRLYRSSETVQQQITRLVLRATT